MKVKQSHRSKLQSIKLSWSNQTIPITKRNAIIKEIIPVSNNNLGFFSINGIRFSIIIPEPTTIFDVIILYSLSYCYFNSFD